MSKKLQNTIVKIFYLQNQSGQREELRGTGSSCGKRSRSCEQTIQLELAHVGQKGPDPMPVAAMCLMQNMYYLQKRQNLLRPYSTYPRIVDGKRGSGWMGKGEQSGWDEGSRVDGTWESGDL